MGEFAGQVTVEHKCFALAPTRDSIAQKFGDARRAKEEILQHWESARAYAKGEIDIRVERMRQQPFDYPYSTPGLLACKAAEMQQGQEGHWRYFDALQKAHMVDCLNIAEAETLMQVAGALALDLPQFARDIQSMEVKERVWQDLELAWHWGVTLVPTVIIDEQWGVPGLVDEATYRRAITEVLAG